MKPVANIKFNQKYYCASTKRYCHAFLNATRTVCMLIECESPTEKELANYKEPTE